MIDSLFETHQQTNSEIQPRILVQFKTYRFYLFLDKYKLDTQQNVCNLQKINFKLKDQKSLHFDKNSDNTKQIQLSFHNLEDELETQQALLQLKNQGQQNKTRIIVFSKQSTLIRLFQYAQSLNVKIENVPIALYSPGLNNDLSRFLGWGSSSMGNLYTKSMVGLQPQVKKWIQSPTQKIDSWTVYITVHEQIGQIYRYSKLKNEEYIQQNKQIKQGFISHLSIGTHPKLFLDYQQGRQGQSGFFDKLAYKFEGFKKFCCMGATNMKASTGIINAKFTDDMGQQHQIFRQFRQNVQMSDDNKKNRYRPKRILSIVVSNIDRFHGNKIKDNQSFKMNDSKLQLLAFQSLNDSTKIATIAGDITLSLQSQKPIYVQINDDCLKLINPKSLLIRKGEKYKILINKQTLGC